MQVLKFGGTSVANAENIRKVVDIVCHALTEDRTLLVCSAISGCTDTLIQIGRLAASRDDQYLALIAQLESRHYTIINELLPEDNRRSVSHIINELFQSLRGITQGVYLLGELSSTSLDAIQAFGELFSTRIIAACFSAKAVNCQWVDSRKIIRTHQEQTNRFSQNVVDMPETTAQLTQLLEQDSFTRLFVFPGFIASDAAGRTTTLGRGGSDYTASLYACCSKARNLEIWTDVSGMMTANPKLVPTARTIPHISYRAALELSHFGAKVVYPPTIQPVVAQGIPIWVKNTFAPNDYGTLIEQNPPLSGQNQVTGISNSDNIALISLEGSGMVGVPGFTSRLFAALSREHINIILITQASSVHTMCIAVSERDAEKARRAADDCFAYEIQLGKLNPLKVEMGFSIVCLVGDNVLGQSGATGRMLTALGSHGIRVRATAQGSSERNVSVIVPSADVQASILHIHNEFFDREPEKVINVYLAGYGTVGRELIRQIGVSESHIARHTGKKIRVCGVANSRHFLLSSEGLSLDNIDTQLESGTSAADNAYFEALAKLNVKHAVFVDCTASSELPYRYPELLHRGFHLVACNKIAFSSAYSLYDAIISAARDNSRNLRYETTVGAALPIVETVKRLLCSGDRIREINAMLSGTLGYLFSKYEGHDFSALVEEARRLGYTEPDPRLDLSGRDVLRKLLIIAREAGLELEEQDVHQTTIPYEDEAAMTALYEEAQKNGTRLRYLATLRINENSKPEASIGLQQVAPDSPFYTLQGSNNAFSVCSDYYPSPLVIQGAGAGAAQTASGVLNDILL